MPLKCSTAPTEPEQTAVETNISELTLRQGYPGTGEESIPGRQEAKPKRSRYRDQRRRSKKNVDYAADNATSTTTDLITEIAESHAALASSSPSDTDTIATEPLSQFPFKRALPQPPMAPFAQVLIAAHYELRDLPCADSQEDDHDQGLFAKQKIDQGTRIISERPLFTLSAPGDQLDELMLAYHNLAESDQERLWNLRPASPDASEQLQNLRSLTDGLAVELHNIILKAETTRTKEEQMMLDEMKPTLEDAMNVWRVAARWHANRCSMTNLPEKQRADLPKGTPITGLFIERAQIRHSCVPNCFASYDANLGRMNVHVTRDVAAGEELTLSAFADNMYYKTAHDRKRELHAWGLMCDCEACDEAHPRFDMHEAARQRAHARVILLTDMLTRLEDVELPEAELNAAQDIVLALIRDLKASGCASVETVRWRNVLVDRILPARALLIPDTEKLLAWQITLGHAKECERVGRICYGEDSEEVRVLRQTREGTQATVTMLEDAVPYDEEKGKWR